jgi:cobalamin biosynthesis protein CobT
VKAEYLTDFGEAATDSMIDVAALAALRPALGEFSIEEEKAAEGEEAAREMEEDDEKEEEEEQPEEEGEGDAEGEDESESERESERERESSESDDAAAEVDEARKERQVRVANAAIAAMEVPSKDPNQPGRPRRGCANGIDYVDWGQGQQYDSTMYQVHDQRDKKAAQRSAKRLDFFSKKCKKAFTQVVE